MPLSSVVDIVAVLAALAAIGVGTGAALSWGWGLAAVGGIVLGLVILSRLVGGRNQ